MGATRTKLALPSTDRHRLETMSDAAREWARRTFDVERRDDQALRGLSFFFGLLFITEVALVLTFGVDYRTVQATYIGPSINLGLFDLPLRHGPCFNQRQMSRLKSAGKTSGTLRTDRI